MSNMSYCRFQNTYQDLRDCYEHLLDKGLGESEKQARRLLIELAQELIQVVDENGGMEEFLEEVDQDAPAADEED